MKKTALVTGAAGFLGSHLCARLLADGFCVVGLDNLQTGRDVNLLPCAKNENFVFHLGDVVNKSDIQRCLDDFGEINEIYNLACPASPPHYQADPIKTLQTSVVGVLNILSFARENSAKVLHASTSEIYGDPLVHPQQELYWGNVNTIGIRSCYDEGKRCAETMCSDYFRQYGVDTRMVRIFNTYGPNMDPQDGRVVSNFIIQALRNEDLTIYGDGSQTRSFQYCDDLIEAMRRFMSLERTAINEFIARKKLGTAVINVGNPNEYTISQLANEVLQQLPESRARIKTLPLPGDDPKRRKPDISFAKELLGWEPKILLQAGLSRTIEYFKTLM